MAFLTDQQTMEDLNLLDKHGDNSIFQIYNRTRTHGGASILENMFRHPLSNHIQIEHRSQTIQFFAASGKVFPFTGQQLDTVTAYLRNTDQRTSLAAQDQSLVKKLGQLIAPDADENAIRHSVHTLLRILKELDRFINGLQLEADHFYNEEKNKVKSILSASPLSPALQLKPDITLSREDLAAWDDLLRFRQREAVIQLMTFIYQLDVYLAIGEVAADRKFIFPKALPANSRMLHVEGVFHPHVKGAVANSITMAAEHNVVFLTGANMAGKSTFMKSLSIALYLAHMGFPVAAREMEFAVLDGMYTTINLPDNLGLGASHFYAEVLRVKKIAAELKQGRNLFVLFDEMFRGTNVKDACEATIAFTEAFAAKINSRFVISTHILEAGEVLQRSCPNIIFVYLPTMMNGNKPVYTYTLAQGLTADRHGMIIIENEGILNILTSGLERNQSNI